MNAVELLAVVVVMILVGLIIAEAVIAFIREEKQRRIQRWKDEGWREGFDAGADVDTKMRRLGDRARRLGR